MKKYIPAPIVIVSFVGLLLAYHFAPWWLFELIIVAFIGIIWGGLWLLGGYAERKKKVNPNQEQEKTEK